MRDLNTWSNKYRVLLFVGLLFVMIVYTVSDKFFSKNSLEANAIESINHIENSNGEKALWQTIDIELEDQIYGALQEISMRFGYSGGAGIVMDINTGKVISLASYPETDESKSVLQNKSTNGLYAPGSIIKPFVAYAALSEGIIDPEKEILSTGSIQIPNPFQEGQSSVFKDWKAHGYVDMTKAIGVSSNVYFYEIGGGFEGQEGLGMERIEKYLKMFGIGITTGIDLISESEGFIPNSVWKEELYGDEWRAGDTYLAAIGQHEYRVTPLQMTRAVAMIANRGKLITPTLQKSNEESSFVHVPLQDDYLEVVRKGMEYAVTNGTASGLYMDGFTLAAKTGTVEVDTEKQFIHSWLIGYFPHDNPRYAFTFLLENGPWGTETGAVAAAEEIFKWIRKNRPEYYNSF